MKQHKFQVNLAGIIDILARHLYSDESVFVRELLQNATDAITARKKANDIFEPQIEFELLRGEDRVLQIIISDNGIGLTEEEVHSFLSVIGASSKKDELLRKKEDFIGQFGIGLLSCFMMAEEIVMISQSIKTEKPVEWRGKADGTYAVKELDKKLSPGTRVFLTIKPEQYHFFEDNNLKELILHFGDFLMYPIFYSEDGKRKRKINKTAFPWESQHLSKAELINFGEKFFEMPVIDCIPLKSHTSGSSGYAFIGTASNTLRQQQKHSVYLHRMFLSDSVDNLLPNWVFFAKCIINSNGLRPTASRESFFEDEILKTTRIELGKSIIEYFYSLRVNNPDLLNSIINRHHIAMKLAAVEDDSFFKSIYGFMPFETNYGHKTIQEILASGNSVKYITDVDEFRKLAAVANLQSIEIINAGYVYEEPFFEKLTELFPEVNIEPYNAEELIWEFKELDSAIQGEVFNFLNEADKALRDFKCRAEIRMFLPENLPALYFKNNDMDFIRKAQQSKDIASDMWNDILGNLTQQQETTALSRICFNYNNPVIKKIVKLNSSELLTVLIRMLYTETLLTGRQPLHQKEMNILTGGLNYLIEKATENEN